MKTFPRLLGKEALSNLDQIHLAPQMFSLLLRLTSWKAFLKQDYRRKKGESQISICVLHYCSLCFFRRLSNTVWTACARCSWNNNTHKNRKSVVSGITKPQCSHISCVSELWKGYELDLMLIYHTPYPQ